MAVSYEVTVGDRVLAVTVRRDGEYYRLVVDGQEHRVQAERLGASLHMLVEGRSYEAVLVRRDAGWEVDLVGATHVVQVVDPRRKALRMARGSGEGLLKSSMPGRVIKILVGEGDGVTRGQPVLVLEAMKMENELKAPCDGTIGKLYVGEGESVQTGTKLLEVSV